MSLRLTAAFILLIAAFVLLTLLLAPAPTNAQSFSIELGDCVYTEDNFSGFAYADTSACGGFLPMMEDAVKEWDNAWRGTSGSSLSVTTGTKTLTVDPGRGFAAGQPVRIVRTSDPNDVQLDGEITAWSDVTDVMVVEVDSVNTAGGAGPYTDWTVFVVRSQSTTVSMPVSIPNGGTGAVDVEGVRANLQVAHYLTIKGFATNPPPTPSAGDTYIVNDFPSGAWSGFSPDNLAIWSGSAWAEEAAVAAMLGYVEASITDSGDPEVYLFDGADWVIVGSRRGLAQPLFGNVSFTTTLGGPNGIFFEIPAASLSAPIVITLANPATYGPYELVIYRLDASAHTVTVNVTGGATIDGASSITIAANTARVIRGFAGSGKVRTTAG